MFFLYLFAISLDPGIDVLHILDSFSIKGQHWYFLCLRWLFLISGFKFFMLDLCHSTMIWTASACELSEAKFLFGNFIDNSPISGSSDLSWLCFAPSSLGSTYPDLNLPHTKILICVTDSSFFLWKLIWIISYFGVLSNLGSIECDGTLSFV